MLHKLNEKATVAKYTETEDRLLRACYEKRQLSREGQRYANERRSVVRQRRRQTEDITEWTGVKIYGVVPHTNY